MAGLREKPPLQAMPANFVHPPCVRYSAASTGDKFYVAGLSTERDGLGSDRYLYLHKDGCWRVTTESEAGLTGYFGTKEEAERALQNAMKSES